MRLMTKEVVLSLADLQSLVIECRSCKTQIVLDLYQALPPMTNARPHGHPENCPICSESFDSAMAKGVADFRKAFLGLNVLKGGGVRLRLKPQPDLSEQKT